MLYKEPDSYVTAKAIVQELTENQKADHTVLAPYLETDATKIKQTYIINDPKPLFRDKV